MKIKLVILFLLVIYSSCDRYSSRKENLLNNEINSYLDARFKSYDTVDYYENNRVKEIQELIHGEFIGDSYKFDSIGNLIGQDNYYNYPNNKWYLDEWVAYNRRGEIDSANSFYAQILIVKKCFKLNAITSEFSEKLDSSRLIVSYGDIVDTLINTSDFKKYEYCLPKNFKGKVKLIYQPMARKYAEIPDELKEIIKKTHDTLLESWFMHKEIVFY